jgi:hypothetical protein
MRVSRYLLCILLALGGPVYGQSVTPTFPVGATAISAVASGAAITLTTATTANVTSVTISPGTWVCSGGINFIAGTIAPTNISGGLTPTSATGPGYDGNFAENVTFPLAAQNRPIGSIVIATAVAMSVFMYAQITFASGTAWKAYGTENCFRIK